MVIRNFRELLDAMGAEGRQKVDQRVRETIASMYTLAESPEVSQSEEVRITQFEELR